MIEQRSTTVYVTSGGFLSYDDRRLLVKILIFLLLNKSYQVIFHKVISSDNSINADFLLIINHVSIISCEKLFN